MRTLLSCALAFLIVNQAGADGKVEKLDPAQLIGRWEIAKAAPGTAPAGAVIEFTKDGTVTVTATVDGKEVSVVGTYVVDGSTITTKVMGKGGETLTVTKLTATEMCGTYQGDHEMVLKRKK